MNKAELVDAVQKKAGGELSKASLNRLVSATFDTIFTSLKKGEPVALVGFGTFSIGKRAARTGRNPQTGEPLKIRASKVAKFTAGKALKEAVNGSAGKKK